MRGYTPTSEVDNGRRNAKTAASLPAKPASKALHPSKTGHGRKGSTTSVQPSGVVGTAGWKKPSATNGGSEPHRWSDLFPRVPVSEPDCPWPPASEPPVSVPTLPSQRLPHSPIAFLNPPPSSSSPLKSPPAVTSSPQESLAPTSPPPVSTPLLHYPSFDGAYSAPLQSPHPPVSSFEYRDCTYYGPSPVPFPYPFSSADPFHSSTPPVPLFVPPGMPSFPPFLPPPAHPPSMAYMQALAGVMEENGVLRHKLARFAELHQRDKEALATAAGAAEQGEREREESEGRVRELEAELEKEKKEREGEVERYWEEVSRRKQLEEKNELLRVGLEEASKLAAKVEREQQEKDELAQREQEMGREEFERVRGEKKEAEERIAKVKGELAASRLVYTALQDEATTQLDELLREYEQLQVKKRTLEERVGEGREG
ncbi:hypothetical protein JCM10207_005632 [Rhodosporidiobolus poonsookiae]